MMKMSLKPVWILALCLFVPAFTMAGGVHYQVSTSTRFYVDEATNLAGIRMNWVYDKAISGIILEGRDTSEAGLKQVGEDMVADLHEQNYMTQFEMNGTPLPVQPVTEYNIKLTGDGSIQLGLQLPLQTPVSVAGKEIQLMLADPYGTASMIYAAEDRITLGDVLSKQCSKPILASEVQDLNEHPITLQSITIRCQ